MTGVRLVYNTDSAASTRRIGRKHIGLHCAESWARYLSCARKLAYVSCLIHRMEQSRDKQNKNSSGDEIANVNFLTTISHTRSPTSKYRKRDKPTSFNKLDDR